MHVLNKLYETFYMWYINLLVLVYSCVRIWQTRVYKYTRIQQFNIRSLSPSLLPPSLSFSLLPPPPLLFWDRASSLIWILTIGLDWLTSQWVSQGSCCLHPLSSGLQLLAGHHSQSLMLVWHALNHLPSPTEIQSLYIWIGVEMQLHDTVCA